MKKQFYIPAIIVSQLFFTISYTNAYYSAEQFRVDIINQIRSDAQKQEQQDIINDLNTSNNRAIDNYNRTMNNLDKEYELKLRELKAKEDQEEWEKMMQDKIEVAKQQAILEKQKKELEEERKKLEEEKWNNTSQEVKDAIKYVDDYIAMTPEERTVEDARKKLKSKEVMPKKVETVKRSNISNTAPIKAQKITPYNYSQPKVSTSTKKEPAGGFFGDLENNTVTPVEKKVTKGSIFDQLIENESPTSVVVVEEKEKKTFFNKLKERFLGLF